MCPGIIIWRQEFSENNLVKFVIIIFWKYSVKRYFLKVYSRLLAHIINHPLTSINTDVHGINTDE